MNENATENHAGLDPAQDVDVLRCRIEQLEHREKELEEDFGLKRAKFKDMYLQKEEELGQRDSLLSSLQDEKASLAVHVQQLQKELDDARSLATVAECTKENDIEQERRKCAEEIASLQHIMKESVAEAERDWKSRYEKELSRFRKLEEELGEMKGHLHYQQQHPPACTATPSTTVHDKEGVLAVVTKSLKQKVGNLGGPNPFSGMSNENLEESMRKAQEDAEMLRSLVLPLEEEIKALKDKLRSTDEQLRAYEAAFSGLVKGLGSDALLDHMLNGKNPCEVVQHLDEKLTSLSQGLQAEKASRSDLEMYVAVLNTQKAVMQEDMERIKRELHEVCELLESEKREHVALKRTWQMANDQFLEAQRLQIQDMRRIQSVLSLEQQRQIMAMKKKDETERRKAESPLHLPQQQQQPVKVEAKSSRPAQPPPRRQDAVVQRSSQSIHLSLPKPLTPLLHRRLHSVDLNAKPSSYEDISKSNPENISWAGSDARLLSAAPSTSQASSIVPEATSGKSVVGRGLRRSRSSSDLNNPELETLALSGIPSLATREPVSEGEATAAEGEDSAKDPAHLLLTQDQVNSLADLTPELEARSTLLESARAEHDSVSLVGKRLVSEKEWKLLEEELGRAREKLGQACQMCGNYELQLQQLQTEERDRGQLLKTANHTLDRYKDDLHREQIFREELEQKFTLATNEYETQVRDVFKQIEESEKLFSQIKSEFSTTQEEALEQLQKLSVERDVIRQELNGLVEDNDILLGKHLSHSQEVSSEDIDLPNCIEEMQFQYLRLREDHIVSLERGERTQSEILILREQIQSEKQQREAVENMLSQEIDSLRQNSVMSDSLRHHSSVLEGKLKLVQEELQKVSNENKASAREYQAKIDRITQMKEQHEQEVHTLRSKVQSLQADLDNSEVVQRDFVKLSQTLQIQLEKIRQADREVRWQHEDDANDCGACSKPLSSRKEKHHCSHCGKIFCGECLAKTVPSGPKNRSYRVCNVCHTLLDHDVAPYFSCEPPQTPS